MKNFYYPRQQPAEGTKWGGEKFYKPVASKRSDSDPSFAQTLLLLRNV
ncbi:MAG TPA: hypothetical protein PK298_06490 [Chitinophagaceae bacterium]|nr:hypothetical protein [Chitinophagaceae bacterium]